MYYRWADCEFAGAMRPGFQDHLIEEDVSLRPPPPDDVFCFMDIDRWRDRIWAMTGDIVTEEVKAHFVRNAPEFLTSDDLGWLDTLVRKVTGVNVDMKDVTANRLTSEFRSFRAAHGTRTDDLAQFYVHGLRRLRADEADLLAARIFLIEEFPHVTADLLQAAIDDVDARNMQSGREGRIHFSANEDNLLSDIGRSGHYLVYGSEYLFCIGIEAAGPVDARRALKSIGRPTMFVCDIPVTLLGPYTLLTFAGKIWEALFCELVPSLECHSLSLGAGSALSICSDLPASCIVGHYHPARVFDPRANR